ncbi:MAG: anti-sigma factor family protein [Candidatus Geothermincolia bacterium]
MSCRRFRKSLIEYSDGRLDEARTAKIEGHLDSCEGCRQAVQMLSLSRLALSTLEAVRMPAAAGDRVASNLAAYGRNDRTAPRPAPSRFSFLWSPRTLAAAGAGVAILLGIVLVVIAYTGPNSGVKKPLDRLASGTQPVSEGSTPAAGASEQKNARDVLPSGTAAILPMVKVSQTNYDENSLRSTFDNMELKKQISSSCTMGQAISMGNLFRRKMSDMMVDAGSDGAMLEAMITYLTNSEPVLLPYYAEHAQFTGQRVYIIGLAGPRRMGETTKLCRTEVWVLSPEKFPANPDSSIVFFLETKTE